MNAALVKAGAHVVQQPLKEWRIGPTGARRARMIVLAMVSGDAQGHAEGEGQGQRAEATPLDHEVMRHLGAEDHPRVRQHLVSCIRFGPRSLRIS
jgi:hypothetical protein